MASSLSDDSLSSASYTSGTDSDDLEDTPAFIKRKSPEKEIKAVAADQSEPPVKRSKLDDLLTEHREQVAEDEDLERKKKELLKSINQKNFLADAPYDCLTEQAASFIKQLDSSAAVVSPEPTGLDVFNSEELCCLFTEDLTPCQCGFTPSHSAMDTVLASVSSKTLSSMVLSKAFIKCIRGHQQADFIKTWLFYLMSIHSSATVTQFCYMNLMSMVQQSKVQTLSPEARHEVVWYPKAADMLKVLVNWGASPDTLLGEQTIYSTQQISDLLTSLSQPTEDVQQKSVRSEALCRNNLALVLNVLSACLQVRPKIPTEELQLMLHMISKMCLDISLQGSLDTELQICLSSILECFPNCQWPAVVPSLCRLLSSVSDNHRDQAHLCELLTSGGRAEWLQISLSYFCMHHLLCPEASALQEDQLRTVELRDVTWLGEPPNPKVYSTLAVTLSELVNSDLYKMSSVIQLLDMCVGTEHRRLVKPRDQLEYLVVQAKQVLKGIRDSIDKEEQSKIKNALSRMIGKWSLSLQGRKSEKRSIFSWPTSGTQPTITEHLLLDRSLASSDVEDDF